MRASSTDHVSSIEDGGLIPIEELIRRMDRPPMTYEEAATAGLGGFETIEELEEFLLWYRAERQRFAG